jgi:hypothetical protein
VRECRDSADHPAALGIVFALDVTGSMGAIPKMLAARELPKFMQVLLGSGVVDPQLLFMAVGDAHFDRAALQVGQFESTANLMDEWLTRSFLEGGGGGNGRESYELALYFLARFNQETGRKIRGFASDAIELMKRYPWPGNIRELKNVVERAVVLSHGEVIGAGDLMLSSLSTASESGEVAPPRLGYEPLSLEDVERRHISQTLNATGWNKSRSAIILGIERSTLDRKISRYQIVQREKEA